jgi:hypothetical protein
MHYRVSIKDPTAFSELCEQALPHLVDFLYNCFPTSDNHLRESAVIDCLLDYQTRPNKYNPDRLPLFSYLRMAVRRDMLNALDKQIRKESRLTSMDDPTAQLYVFDRANKDHQDDLDGWLQENSSLSFNEILEALDEKLDTLEKEALILMLEGRRESSAYYSILQISHLDDQSARKEVKKIKDRIMKKLSRLGDKIRLEKSDQRV